MHNNLPTSSPNLSGNNQGGVIIDRLLRLRKELKREKLAAYIFLSTDPHCGEYVPEHWKGREWISGFTGSAGIAVVTMSSAALWTDSRYFLAAERELADTEYVLMKEGLAGTPAVAAWLGRELSDGNCKEVGIDGTAASYDYISALKMELRQNGGLLLRTNFDPLERIWTGRPPLPKGLIRRHDLRYAGEEAASKLARTRSALRTIHADGTLVTTLDDIAWLLNLRGSDVRRNPVFISYLLITSRTTVLFTDSAKLDAGVKAYLSSLGIDIKEYNEVQKALAAYPDYSILIDGKLTNHRLATAVKCKHIIYGASPVPALKAVKNAAEISGFRRAMLRDGVAMVKFLYWLKPAVLHGGVTERAVDERLTAFRAEQELFCGLSFDTIAAYGAHAAIVHYEATPATDTELKPEGFLLIDSGAQYLDGTTDITRTIPLGPLSDEQRRVYTLVLKGHIRLEMAKFPAGRTAGTQLDCLAREALWRAGMNYLHGTGHGVGSFLNVHEGPHQIRQEWCGTPLAAGMTVTDEPGVYLEGRFGVRIENTLLVTDYVQTEFGRFLQFEPLTLCPIDTSPIIRELLGEEEIAWLNAYHAKVYDALCPLLSDAGERAWLRDNTLPF
ncbi:MAG: aminopeptidase P family protein [Prevotella sp.]|nr:aminopeptidase P family protein [Prevotella sp.]